MLHDLMPLSTEAPRCSDFARATGLLPTGTGLFLERVILVSVPLPWPKPALQHENLRAVTAHVVASTIPTRLFAAEPVEGEVRVEVFERRGAEAALCSWKLTDSARVESLIESVAGEPVGSLASLDVSGAELEVSSGSLPPTFLVCTQGSHDSCCGTSGVALADQIEAARPDYIVRRVSHTGGHRFSPTFLAFPEGRMWAFADLDLVDRIATRETTAADHQSRARGWWGAKVGPAQVAESVVRSQLVGQAFEPPQIELLDDNDGTKTFAVATASESWRVQVTVGRQVPTVACEAPGGLPAKPGREFAWSIERA